MRSTGFIFVSLLIHALIIIFIALSPQQISEFTKGSTVEVEVGSPAQTPGVPEAPKVTETAPPAATPAVPTPMVAPAPTPAPTPAPAPQPQPVAAQPTPHPQPVAAKPAPAPAPKPVATAAPKKAAKPSAVAKSDVGALPKKLNQPPPQKLDPAIEEAGVIPVGSETDQDTEATSQDAKNASVDPAPVGLKEEPAQAPAPPQGAAETAPTAAPAQAAAASQGPTGELGKGGATQAGAVEFTDLKQMSGNRAPMYPLSARKEKRQGEVELLYRVTKEGAVTDIKIAKSSGSDDLDQEAVRAISKFRFVPGQEGWAKHPVNFELKGETAALPSRLRSQVGAQE